MKFSTLLLIVSGLSYLAASVAFYIPIALELIILIIVIQWTSLIAAWYQIIKGN